MKMILKRSELPCPISDLRWLKFLSKYKNVPLQEFGGNYYQPMIKYIHSKEILGPYQEREEIYMPDKCEVISDKYSNM